MRKLVSVVEVSEILEHTNADLLEIARIKGWNCVVGKGTFKAGDIGIYFEIDSFIPIDKPYVLYKNSRMYDGIEGTRIRTMKLRGEISQGLLIPISEIQELEGVTLSIGDELTDKLGILKYERPVEFITGDVKGNIPGFIIKTDQERIQNIMDDDVTGEWEYSEKLEGTSMTIYSEESNFGVCGKTLEYLRDDTEPYWKAALALGIETKLNNIGFNVALQGELVGPKIQDNIYGLKRHEFRLFDIQNLDERRKLLPEERAEIVSLLNKDSDVKVLEAPVLGFIKLDGLVKDNIETLLKMADGRSSLNESVWREGIVFKKVDKQISFKCISNKYLLKEK